MNENLINNEEKHNKSKCLNHFVKNKNKYYPIFQVLSFFCSLIIIVIISIMYAVNKFDAETSRIISEELLDNFNTGYFIEFSKCSTPSNNMQSSEITNYNNVKFGTWQGTRKGCANKADNSKQPRKLESGKECKDDEITLEEIPSQDIFIYKNISLCAITKGSYYDLLNDGSIIGKGETCPQGKKNCGYIDTLKNILCLDIDLDCPISYIKVSNDPPDITNMETIKGNKINIYYSNNPYENSKEIPYIQSGFKIADSMICSLPTIYYSRVTLYSLDTFKREYSENCISDSYIQQINEDKIRYHSLDKVDNYQLYEENKIISKIERSQLPNYGYNTSIYKDHYLTLYVRTHFGFNKTCLDNRKKKFDIKELSLIHYKAKDIETFKLLFLVISIIIFIISLVNLIVFCKDCKYIIIFIINLVIFVAYVFLFVYFIIKARYINDGYEDEMTCSDDVTNSNYNFMVEKIRTNGQCIFVIFIFICVILGFNLLSIILLILLLCIGVSNEKKIQEEDKNNGDSSKKNPEKKEKKIPNLELSISDIKIEDNENNQIIEEDNKEDKDILND